jgi:hypothetical protein
MNAVMIVNAGNLKMNGSLGTKMTDGTTILEHFVEALNGGDEATFRFS